MRSATHSATEGGVTLQQHSRSRSFGFGLCSLLLAISAATTSSTQGATAAGMHAGRGDTSSSSAPFQRSSARPDLFQDLPDFVEDMFYDAFCYHDFFTQRDACPTNMYDLHRCIKTTFRRTAGTQKKKVGEEEEEEEEDELAVADATPRLTPQHDKNDLSSANTDGGSSHSEEEVEISSLQMYINGEASCSSVRSSTARSSPSSSLVGSELVVYGSESSNNAEMVVFVVPASTSAELRQGCLDATRLLLRALPSTEGIADQSANDGLLSALVCVPYVHPSSTKQPLSMSSTLGSGRSSATTPVAQQCARVSDDAQTDASPAFPDTTEDVTVYRLFLGQLRKEASTEFVQFLLEEIMGMDVSSGDVVSIEMHTAAPPAAAHRAAGRVGAGSDNNVTTGLLPRAKGCAWVDVRGAAARDRILSFHKRLYLGDKTMFALEGDGQWDGGCVPTRASEEFVVVVDEDHREWLAHASAAWTNRPDRSREFLSRGPIVVEVPKQQTAPPRRSSRNATADNNVVQPTTSAQLKQLLGTNATTDAAAASSPHRGELRSGCAYFSKVQPPRFPPVTQRGDHVNSTTDDRIDNGNATTALSGSTIFAWRHDPYNAVQPWIMQTM